MIQEQVAPATEEWRPVVGYEGLYQVSNTGKVKRIAPNHGATEGRILKPAVNHRGYERVSLTVNCITHRKLVHRLVAEAFIGPCGSGLFVNHIDGNKRNNKLLNLEYVSSAENSRHAVQIGLIVRGELSPSSKITKAKADEIRSLKGLMSYGKIGKKYGLCRKSIYRIMNNLSYT